MEDSNNQNKKNSCFLSCCGCNTKQGSIGWGVFFLVLGVYFAAQELGYVTLDISFWTIALIALGVYFVVRGFSK